MARHRHCEAAWCQTADCGGEGGGAKHLAFQQFENDLEIQDYLFQAFVAHHPGDALGRASTRAQILSPGNPTTASGALLAFRKREELHERAKRFGVVWPELYERHGALDSAISAALSHDKLVELRYNSLRL